MTNRPLIFITNDDGFRAKGIGELIKTVRRLGDVIVVAPEANASGKGHSMTMGMPLRVKEVERTQGLTVYSCSGTPVDCVKVGVDAFCPRRPSIVLSGINHGSNASVNVIYSGTMGAALEAALMGLPSVGLSLLSYDHNADFAFCLKSIEDIVVSVLNDGLPQGIALNVNIPYLDRAEELKGVRVCRAAEAHWSDCAVPRQDPFGEPYYWIAGSIDYNEQDVDTDAWVLSHGYISIVPSRADYTAHDMIPALQHRYIH